MKTISLITVLLIAASIVAHKRAQRLQTYDEQKQAAILQTVKDSVPSCAFTYSYRHTGWEIPGLSSAKPLGQRGNLVLSGRRTDIFITRFEPPTEPISILVPECSASRPGQLELPIQPMRIKELWRFDVDGRVFAYGISAGWVGIGSEGKIVAIGTESDVLFIDDVGDGTFRKMQFTSFPFRIEKPDWLKRRN